MTNIEESGHANMEAIQTVAFIGLGAIGSVMYDLLAKTIPANQLYAIATGSRAERLAASGIVVNRVAYRPKLADLGLEKTKADLIVVAVKGYQLEQAIEDIKPYVGEQTLIISLLNGIGSEERLIAAYGSERVLYSLTYVNAICIDNATSYQPSACLIKVGERRNDTLTARVRRISQLFDQANVQYDIPQDMIYELWYKFLINVSGNTVSALLRAPYAFFQRFEACTAARVAIMNEVVQLSQTLGTGLSSMDVDKAIDVYAIYDPNAKSSMLQDIEAGKRTENEELAGEVIRLADKAGVSVPATRFAYEMLRALEQAIVEGL